MRIVAFIFLITTIMSCGVFRFAKDPTCTTCNELFSIIHNNIEWKKIKTKYGYDEDVAEMPYNIPKINKLLDSLQCFKGMHDTSLMRIFKNKKPYSKMDILDERGSFKTNIIEIIFQDKTNNYNNGKYYLWRFAVWNNGLLDYITGERGTNYKIVNLSR